MKLVCVYTVHTHYKRTVLVYYSLRITGFSNFTNVLQTMKENVTCNNLYGLSKKTEKFSWVYYEYSKYSCVNLTK